jgi:hypothetical protein
MKSSSSDGVLGNRHGKQSPRDSMMRIKADQYLSSAMKEATRLLQGVNKRRSVGPQETASFNERDLMIDLGGRLRVLSEIFTEGSMESM